MSCSFECNIVTKFRLKWPPSGHTLTTRNGALMGHNSFALIKECKWNVLCARLNFAMWDFSTAVFVHCYNTNTGTFKRDDFIAQYFVEENPRTFPNPSPPLPPPLSSCQHFRLSIKAKRPKNKYNKKSLLSNSH